MVDGRLDRARLLSVTDREVEAGRLSEADEIRRYALGDDHAFDGYRSEEHTSELQSLMRISYAVFCLKKKKTNTTKTTIEASTIPHLYAMIRVQENTITN